jgi:hypothetical protein
MSFFAILFALLIEQARPLARSNPIHAGLRAWALSVSRNFDAGKPHHGWVAWGLAVLVPPLVTLAVHWLLMCWVGWPLAVVWSVAVLYVTLGFRQFSHHFTGIRDALEEGDEDRARERLAHWQQVDVGDAAAQRDRAPCDRIFGAGGAPPCVWRAGMVFCAGCAGPGAYGCGAVPAGRICLALLASQGALGRTTCQPVVAAGLGRGPGPSSTGCLRA